MSPSQSSIAVVLLRVAGVGCQAIMFALLANVLPPAGLGIFSGVYVFWGLVRMLGPIGLDQIAMREISCARANSDSALAAAVAAHACRVAAVTTSLLAVVTFCVLQRLVWKGGVSLATWELLTIALAVPAFGFAGLLTAIVRACDRNIASQGIKSVGLQVLTVVFLGAHWAIGKVTLVSALLTQATCAWITVAVCAFMLRDFMAARASSIGADLKERLRRECIELSQALVLIGLAARAPTFISLSLLGPAATAVLEIALRFGTLPTIFTAAVSTTFGPTLAQQHARNDKAGLANSLATASWLSFLPSAATLIGTIVLGPWLLATFFPPVYANAYVPLLLIVASTTINGTFGMSSTVLMMTGNARVVRLYSVVQFVVVVVLSTLLALTIGIEGPALAILAGFIAFDAGLATRIKPLLGIRGILHPSGLADLGRGLKFGSWRVPVENAK